MIRLTNRESLTALENRPGGTVTMMVIRIGVAAICAWVSLAAVSGSGPSTRRAQSATATGASTRATVYFKWPFEAEEAARRQAETAKHLGIGGEIVLALSKDSKLKLQLIPAGEFLMGSPEEETHRNKDEGPQRKVRIAAPFYMSATEVTRGQFAAFVADSRYRTDAEKQGWSTAWQGGLKWGYVKGASWRKPGFKQTDAHPVVCVSWNDASAFCKWLTRKTGRRIRLPLEAEWEYACRAGTDTAYQWGAGEGRMDGKGWHNAADQAGALRFRPWVDNGVPWNDGYVFTAPVASYRRNAWGLYDMHGNVTEWCDDWYEAIYYARARDGGGPMGPKSGITRVVRGGSWFSWHWRLRSACRARGLGGSSPDFAAVYFGFRIAAELKGPTAGTTRPASPASRPAAKAKP